MTPFLYSTQHFLAHSVATCYLPPAMEQSTMRGVLLTALSPVSRAGSGMWQMPTFENNWKTIENPLPTALSVTVISVLELRVSEWASEVAQSCPTLCDPMDCSPPGFSVHGILQAKILEWVAIFFSRGSSQSRDQTQVSGIGGKYFNLWASREALTPKATRKRTTTTKKTVSRRKEIIKSEPKWMKKKWRL